MKARYVICTFVAGLALLTFTLTVMAFQAEAGRATTTSPRPSNGVSLTLEVAGLPLEPRSVLLANARLQPKPVDAVALGNLTPMVAMTGSDLLPQTAFGGSTWAVTGAGNRLYYNEGAELVIADSTDPLDPVPLGRWSTTDKAGFNELHVAGSRIYVPHGSEGADILDVSNPGEPVRIGNIPMRYIGGSGSSIYAVATNSTGSIAYVIQGKLFRVVDVSTPAAVHDTAVITPSTSYLGSLVVAGQYAYVSAGTSGLVVVDVLNPAAPTIIGTLDTPGYARRLAKQGNYIFLGDGDAVRIVSVQNPAAPVQVGVYQPASFSPTGLAIAGNYLYVQVYGTPAVHVVDVSTPASPTLAGTLDLPSSGYSVYIAGTTAYLDTQDDGLAVTDITNPVVPVVVTMLDTVPNIRAVAEVGRFILLGARHTLWVATTDGPALAAMPVFTSSDLFGTVRASGHLALLAIYDELTDASTLQVLDVAAPFAPAPLGLTALSIPNASSLAITGTHAYVGSWYGISVVNFTDPQAPYEVSWLATPGVNVRGLAVQGARLYVATTPGGLSIYDISSPGTLTYLGELSGINGQDVAVVGRYAYVAANTGQNLQVVDVLTPTAPVLVRSLSACGSGWAVAVSSGYAYLANGCQGLQLYDIRDPLGGPSYSVASADLPTYGDEVGVSGDRVLVADGSGGFVQLGRYEYTTDLIPTTGGGLVAPDCNVSVTVPADTFTDTVVLTYAEVPPLGTGGLASGGPFFEMTARYLSGQYAALPVGHSLTVVLNYAPSPVRPDTLELYRWTGLEWTDTGITSTVYTTTHQVVAQLSTFSGSETFALLGTPFSTFLPALRR